MHRIIDWLGGLSGPVVYAVVGALVFAEDALFVGFVLPGETAVVIGGVLASQGKVSVGWLALTVVVAAIAGDSTGYEIGHRFGPRLMSTRPLRRHAGRIDKARDLIRRRGPVAVFFGRFIAFFRAMMPALAGISRMPYRKFLLFNALGGLTWGIGFTLLGYFAGAAYTQIEGLVGRGIAIVIAAIVIAALIVWHVRRRRESDATPQAEGARACPEAAAGEGPDADRNGKHGENGKHADQGRDEGPAADKDVRHAGKPDLSQDGSPAEDQDGDHGGKPDEPPDLSQGRTPDAD